MTADRGDIYRYLGCRDSQPPAELRQMVEDCLAALEKAAELKLIDGYCLGDLTDRQARAWLRETADTMPGGFTACIRWMKRWKGRCASAGCP